LNLHFGIANMSNTALNNHDPELYEEFSTAIAQGDVEKVRECIERGVNIHLSHIDDHTPLGAAAFEGHLEIVKIGVAG
jgi:ankyrin repeat protein